MRQGFNPGGPGKQYSSEIMNQIGDRCHNAQNRNWCPIRHCRPQRSWPLTAALHSLQPWPVRGCLFQPNSPLPGVHVPEQRLVLMPRIPGTGGKGHPFCLATLRWKWAAPVNMLPTQGKVRENHQLRSSIRSDGGKARQGVEGFMDY